MPASGSPVRPEAEVTAIAGADAALPRPPRAFVSLWLAGTVLFIVLAAFAKNADRFPTDLGVTRAIQGIDVEAFIRAMDWGEDLSDAPDTTKLPGGRVVGCEDLPGDVPSCIVISLATPNAVWVMLGALAVLLITRKRWEAAGLLVTGPFLIFSAIVERIVGRPSPPDDLVRVLTPPGEFSFPSGHVGGAVFFYGLLFYLAICFVRPPLLRLALQAACVYFVTFTAMERLYVGVHWFSDVYSGALHGALWLALVIWGHRQWVSPGLTPEQ